MGNPRAGSSPVIRIFTRRNLLIKKEASSFFFVIFYIINFVFIPWSKADVGVQLKVKSDFCIINIILV